MVMGGVCEAVEEAIGKALTEDSSFLPDAELEAELFALESLRAKRLGLLIRDRHCRGPGCDLAVHRCQADHIQLFDPGLTLLANGRVLCGPCHRHKTRLQTHRIDLPDAWSS